MNTVSTATRGPSAADKEYSVQASARPTTDVFEVDAAP